LSYIRPIRRTPAKEAQNLSYIRPFRRTPAKKAQNLSYIRPFRRTPAKEAQNLSYIRSFRRTPAKKALPPEESGGCGKQGKQKGGINVLLPAYSWHQEADS
jgi:hypothetical protein